MSAKNLTGKVIFRSFTYETGVLEHQTEFETLADLFDLCLQAGDPELVERVIVSGLDSNKKMRTISFVFESQSVGNGAK